MSRTAWQDYRGNTANDKDESRVITQAVTTPPFNREPHKMCVRLLDAFRFEGEVVSTVGAA